MGGYIRVHVVSEPNQNQTKVKRAQIRLTATDDDPQIIEALFFSGLLSISHVSIGFDSIVHPHAAHFLDRRQCASSSSSSEMGSLESVEDMGSGPPSVGRRGGFRPMGVPPFQLPPTDAVPPASL